jgi:hypothetical protein
MSAFMGPYKIKEYTSGKSSYMKCECGKVCFSSLQIVQHIQFDHKIPVKIAHMCWVNREKINNDPKNEER